MVLGKAGSSGQSRTGLDQAALARFTICVALHQPKPEVK
jgi:hypothetical protein